MNLDERINEFKKTIELWKSMNPATQNKAGIELIKYIYKITPAKDIPHFQKNKDLGIYKTPKNNK